VYKDTDLNASYKLEGFFTQNKPAIWLNSVKKREGRNYREPKDGSKIYKNSWKMSVGVTQI
jgi:hypothetical protein